MVDSLHWKPVSPIAGSMRNCAHSSEQLTMQVMRRRAVVAGGCHLLDPRLFPSSGIWRSFSRGCGQAAVISRAFRGHRLLVADWNVFQRST